MSVFLTARTGQAAKPGRGTGSLPVTGILADGGTFSGTISNLTSSVNKGISQ